MAQFASSAGIISPYEIDSPQKNKPMAGAMGIVFACFGFAMFLASQASVAGSESMAIIIIGAIILLFTMIDIEFGIYCLVAGMLLSPEIPLPFVKLPNRMVVARIDDLMIIVVGMAWFAQTAIRGKLQMLRSTPLNRPIGWFSFLTIISTVRGMFTGSVGHPLTAFFYVLKFMEFFLLYFLIVNNIAGETQVRRIMTSYFLTVAIVVAYATWAAVLTKEVGRATTPFETAEEPGTLGGYLLFSFALAFGLLNYVPNFFAKIVYLLIMISIVPPFLYTLSRGSYLAFLPMFLTVLLLSKRRGIPILLLIVLGMATPWLPNVTIERVEYTFQNRVETSVDDRGEEVKTNVLDPSSEARLQRYQGVIEQWMYRPLLGQGVTGVGFVDGQIVRVLGEVGLLGLLTLAWLFKNLFQTALSLYRSLPNGYMKGLVLGMIAGTVGLVFHGATANTFTVVRIAGPFWAVTGLIMVVYKVHEAEVAASEA